MELYMENDNYNQGIANEMMNFKTGWSKRFDVINSILLEHAKI